MESRPFISIAEDCFPDPTMMGPVNSLMVSPDRLETVTCINASTGSFVIRLFKNIKKLESLYRIQHIYCFSLNVFDKQMFKDLKMNLLQCSFFCRSSLSYIYLLPSSPSPLISSTGGLDL
jgi:hypothetical protein